MFFYDIIYCIIPVDIVLFFLDAGAGSLITKVCLTVKKLYSVRNRKTLRNFLCIYQVLLKI